MTKAAFIDSVNELYAMRDRVAKNAKYIISDMLDNVGEMDSEYLYGESFDQRWIWVGNDEHVVALLKGKSSDTHIVYLEDDNDFSREVYLCDMSPEDVIEIADFLCRM